MQDKAASTDDNEEDPLLADVYEYLTKFDFPLHS